MNETNKKKIKIFKSMKSKQKQKRKSEKEVRNEKKMNEK